MGQGPRGGEVAVAVCGLRGQQAGPSCAVSRWDQRINVTVLAVTMWVVTSGGNSVKDAWDVAVCSFIQIHVNLQLHLEKKMFN